MINANIEQFELVELFGKPTPVLFTCLRVDRTTVPDGMYVYSVRHDDEGNGEPCEIAKRVIVNHWGDILSVFPIRLTPLSGNDYYCRTLDEEDFNYLGTTMSLAEYISEYSIGDYEEV